MLIVSVSEGSLDLYEEARQRPQGPQRVRKQPFFSEKGRLARLMMITPCQRPRTGLKSAVPTEPSRGLMPAALTEPFLKMSVPTTLSTPITPSPSTRLRERRFVSGTEEDAAQGY